MRIKAVSFLLGLAVCILKGGDAVGAVIVVYATLIMQGDKTFAQVPNSIKPAVEQQLYVMGLDTEGKPLPTEPAA